MPKPILATLAAIVALALAYFVLPALGPKDTPAPNDAGIAPVLVAIPSNNALRLMLQAAKQLQLPPNLQPRTFLKQEMWIASEAARLLGTNKDALATLETALQTPNTQNLTHDQTLQSNTTYRQDVSSNMIQVHQLGELLLVRGEEQRRNGDTANAIQTIFNTLEMAKRLRTSGSSLELESGSSLGKLAHAQLRALLGEIKNASTLRGLLKILPAHAPTIAQLETAHRADHRLGVLQLTALGNNDPTALQATTQKLSGIPKALALALPRAYTYQPNRTHTTWTATTRQALQRDKNCAPPPPPNNTSDPNPFAPNAIGEAFGQNNPANDAARLAWCEELQSHNATILATAIRTAQLERGNLPERLEMLPSGILTTQPRDPFSPGGMQAFAWDIISKTLRGSNNTGYQLGF